LLPSANKRGEGRDATVGSLFENAPVCKRGDSRMWRLTNLSSVKKVGRRKNQVSRGSGKTKKKKRCDVRQGVEKKGGRRRSSAFIGLKKRSKIWEITRHSGVGAKRA